jgi:predicted membrane protein
MTTIKYVYFEDKFRAICIEQSWQHPIAEFFDIYRLQNLISPVQSVQRFEKVWEWERSCIHGFHAKIRYYIYQMLHNIIVSNIVTIRLA